MLTKVEVRNAAGELLTLTLDDATDGFIVENIKGLGPVKATIVSSSFARLDGVQYQSSSREARNLVFTVGLEPDYVTTQVSDLRDQLYDYFISDSQVFLRFFINGLVVKTEGRVETCEPSIFTNEPAVDISIICFDPDFYVLDTTEVAGNTVSTSTEFTIAYPGNAKTGYIFTLNINRTLSAFTIYHRTPDGVLRSMDFAASFVSGDVLTVSTVRGNKYVTLTRAATDSSLLYALSPQSPWLELSKGDNDLRVYATGAAIPFTIDYVTRYGGL